MEAQLHQSNLDDAALFPLQQAAGIGRHKQQKRYEELEAWVDGWIKQYQEAKEEVNDQL